MQKVIIQTRFDRLKYFMRMMKKKYLRKPFTESELIEMAVRKETLPEDFLLYCTDEEAWWVGMLNMKIENNS
jgi:hypothetical protein